ncbi:MAG: SocA family protein [Candidatus Yanofskybacteria bacterium]|nr:SocA family protein [Candidatus Yanofskybacteria bacterium]
MALKTKKMAKIDTQKYESVILYIAQKLGGEIRGKKKLAKLLYFVDFDYFEKNSHPIIGDTYKALPMGPFPEHMTDIIQELSNEGKINVKTVDERPGYNATEVYKLVSGDLKFNLSMDEIKIIDRVVQKYGHLNGKELEILTHAEAPYVGTKSGEIIAYELAYYRGTDFSISA